MIRQWHFQEKRRQAENVRILRAILISLLFIFACSDSSISELEKSQTSLAKIEASFNELAKEQSTDIVRMGRLDQDIRNFQNEISDINVSPIKKAEIATKTEALLIKIDNYNVNQLIAVKPKGHWFKVKEVGEDGALFAFLIIQHAPFDIQEKYFEELQQAAKSNDIKQTHFAMFYDRIMVRRGLKQKYGTQFQCQNGKLTPFPMLDPKNINRIRNEAGFFETFEEYSNTINANSNCR